MHAELTHDNLITITSNIHKLRSYLPNADRIGLGTDVKDSRVAVSSYSVENLVGQPNIAKWEKLPAKVGTQ